MQDAALLTIQNQLNSSTSIIPAKPTQMTSLTAVFLASERLRADFQATHDVPLYSMSDAAAEATVDLRAALAAERTDVLADLWDADNARSTIPSIFD